MPEVVTRVVVSNADEQNRDPISGAPGSHPLGTGAGATAGGLAGAATGMAVGGPVGSVIGAAVGAVAGAIAGHEAAEAANPTAEETYWRESYLLESFYEPGRAYEYYAPGFRAGWDGRVLHDGRTFTEAEIDLAEAYNSTKSELDPDWHAIRPAASAAWDRVEKHRATAYSIDQAITQHGR